MNLDSKAALMALAEHDSPPRLSRNHEGIGQQGVTVMGAKHTGVVAMRRQMGRPALNILSLDQNQHVGIMQPHRESCTIVGS